MGASRLQYVAQLLVVAALFVIAGKISLLVAFVGVVAPLWLPAGVSLSAVLLLGGRVWPGVALGAFLTNLATGAPLVFCAAAAVGNTLEPLLGAWLLRKWKGFGPSLARHRDVVALTGVAAIVSPAISATLGVTALCLTRMSPWPAYGSAWTTWWLGDATGVLIAAPALLTWLARRGGGVGVRRGLEGAAMLLVSAVGSVLVFSGVLTRAWAHGPITFLIFPVIIWGALRFGPRGAASVSAVIALTAIWGTAHGHGPFADPDLFMSAKLLQTYIGTVGVSALLLASLVAEREGSREALAQSEALQRSVLDSLKEVVFRADRDGNWLFLNPAWTELTGFSVEESLGTNCLDYVHSEDRGIALGLYRALARLDSNAVRAELRVRIRDGGQRWVEIHARRLVDADGRMAGTTGTLIDVSQRKQAEDERLNLEKQLLHAQKMESIGRLAGGVAHDFNNILMAVAGNAELLASNLRPDDERRELVAEISRASERASSLTRQLLAFSRRQVIEPRVLDLNEAIGDLADMLRRVLGEDIELRLELNPAAGRVHVDPGQLSQIILNLAINARDAMPRGGRLRLESGTFRTEPGGPAPPFKHQRYATITMTDVGAGMSPDVLPHIFEPFYTTKSPGKGTGLGLSTVYGIVQQSGGEIEVASVPGEGTTFRIYLPRSAEPLPPAPAPPKDEGYSPRGVRILFVEDDDAARGFAEKALTARGHRVVPARSAEEALELVQDRGLEVDMLLSDVVLPGINGPALAEELRRRHPGLPVLFVSGYDFDYISRDRVIREDVSYLQKPFTIDALAARIHEVLERARSAAA